MPYFKYLELGLISHAGISYCRQTLAAVPTALLAAGTCLEPSGEVPTEGGANSVLKCGSTRNGIAVNEEARSS